MIEKTRKQLRLERRLERQVIRRDKSFARKQRQQDNPFPGRYL